MVYEWATAKFNNKRLEIENGGGYQSRMDCILYMLVQAYNRVKDRLPETDVEIALTSWDMPWKNPFPHIPQERVYYMSDTRDRAHTCFPCFSIVNWPEAQNFNTDELIKEIHRAGDIPPEDDRLFWTGALCTHPNRNILNQLGSENPDKILCIPMVWLNNGSTPSHFISLPDHAKYAYLIDMEGSAYSARLVYLAHHKRPLFIQDRPYWDWVTANMQPNVHYVPVKRDLSDLLEKLEYAKSHPEEMEKMVEARLQFAREHISIDKGIEQAIKVVFEPHMVR